MNLLKSQNSTIMFRKITSIAIAIAISTLFVFGQFDAHIVKRTNDHKGTPTFLKFKKNHYHKDDIKSAIVNHLPIRSTDQLKLHKSETDPLGFKHHKYQQYYKGIKVEYGTYTVHTENNSLSAMGGEFKQVSDALNTNPTLTEAQALSAALDNIRAKHYKWQSIQNEAWLKAEQGNLKATFYPKAELVIVENYRNRHDREKYRQPTLAYKFDIYAEQPLSRDYVYIDAHTGEVVHQNPIIKHAAANGTCHTKYSGVKTLATDSYSGTYRLRDYTRGSGIVTLNMQGGTDYNFAVDFTDSDNVWSEWNNATQDNAALDAHYGAQATYDYFLQKHNRNSYDDSGAALYNYVHFDTNYDNAFWDGTRMIYGDGSQRFSALTSMDITAHEIAHALCSNTADLVYSYESGALNEGFSDIWAACVEAHTEPNKSPWLIAEDVILQGTALRSMSDPNSENQPDTYGGTYWHTDDTDNGGVHVNSGVINHWFYLLTTGGSGTNDIGDTYNITGIGMDAAAQIAYRTEAVYLSPNSNYSSARIFSIQAAEDIFGACSVELIAVTNAWYAVGLGGASNCENDNENSSYCTSQGNNSNYEWIASVSLDDFTKNSAGTPYSDFTSLIVRLPVGQSVNVSITPGFSGAAYSDTYRIWIDYNADGDFEDANELVFSAGPTNTAATGSINIPASASGTTRLRVSMRYNSAPPVCGNFDYGEVEDYTVQFGATLTLACNDGIQNGNEAGVDCGGTCPPCSGGGGYCNASAGSSQHQWIDYIGTTQTGGNISNGSSGYQDFTNVSFNISQGGTQPLYFSKGPDVGYHFYWSIYIDFNQDGDFDDTDEQVVQGSSTNSGLLSANADIPANAMLGQTRMRVTMKYGSTAGFCENFTYGEVEDYTVNVVNNLMNEVKNEDILSLDNELINSDVLTIFPNPAVDIIHIQIPIFEIATTAFIYDLNGSLIHQFKCNNKQQELNIEHLPQGMYILSVESAKQIFSKKFIKN